MSAALSTAIVAGASGLLIVGAVALAIFVLLIVGAIVALAIFVLVLITKFLVGAVIATKTAIGCGCLLPAFVIGCLLLVYAWNSISAAL
jgi:hypothetical protein